MKKYLKFAFKHYKLEILVILIISIFQTYFQLQIINLFKTALSHVEHEELVLLNSDGQMMLIYSAILILSMIALIYLVNNISIKIAHETRRKEFNVINHIPQKEVNKLRSTDMMSRATRGAYTEQRFIQMLLKDILIIPLVTLGIIIEIFLIDKQFAFFFTIFVIIITAIVIYKLKKISKVYFGAKKAFGDINFLYREKAMCLKVIRIFKKKFFEKKIYGESLDETYDICIDYQLDQYHIFPLVMLFSDLMIVVILINLFDFTINPGVSVLNPIKYYSEFVNIVIIIQYLLYFVSTISVLPNLIASWPSIYTTSIRIEELIDLEDTIITSKDNALKSDFKGIEFKNVSFKNEEHEIIKNVSFKIPDKSTVAIVGPYSSGKTILMYLLDRIYDVDEGEILIDGVNINALTSNELKGKINFAMQEKFILNDTVYNNIALGDKKITSKDVSKACDESGLSQLFNDEFNLDTMIFEQGSNISNTYKNKIMLARSIVHEKDIYIFDEYDYHVENKTNILLTKEIEQIKDIEHIIVLDQGQIVGEGNHEDLLEDCLTYNKLYMGGK